MSRAFTTAILGGSLALAACLAACGSSGGTPGGTSSQSSTSAKGATGSASATTGRGTAASTSAGTSSSGGKGASSAGSGTTTASGKGSASSAGSGATSTGGTGAGGISVGSLTLTPTTVKVGQTIDGAATLTNHGANAVALTDVVIAARPSTGTNQGGPFIDLFHAGPQTLAAGGTFQLQGGRAVTASDPVGSCYAYVTYEDAQATWHDQAQDVTFTITATTTSSGTTSGSSSAGTSGTTSGGSSGGGTSSGGTTGTVIAGTTAGTLSVDLASLTGESVAGTLFGFGTGAFGDNGFAFTGVPAIQSQAKQLTPTLIRFNMNANVGGTQGLEDAIFQNGVASPQWQYFDPLFDNAPTWFAPNTQILMGLGSAVNPNISPADLAAWATALADRAIQKGREITLWEVWNEPNGVIPDATYNAWFNAVADALHAVNPNNKVFGPVHSYVAGAPDTSLQSWANACGAKADGICMHTYGYDHWSNDAELFAATDMADQVSSMRASVAGTPAADLPLVLGEWNIDSAAATIPQEQQIQDAVYDAVNLYRAIDLNVKAEYGANWEIYGDNTYGVINDPGNGFFSDYRIFPAGYYLGYAGQVLNGSRASATLAIGGNVYALVVVSGSSYAIQVINYDSTTDLQAFTVGLKAPSGVGASVTRWELSPASLTPAISTVLATDLSSTGTTIPAEGIVIFTGTFQ